MGTNLQTGFSKHYSVETEAVNATPEQITVPDGATLVTIWGTEDWRLYNPIVGGAQFINDTDYIVVKKADVASDPPSVANQIPVANVNALRVARDSIDGTLSIVWEYGQK